MPHWGGALAGWAGSELTGIALPSFAAEAEIRGGQGHMTQGTKSIAAAPGSFVSFSSVEEELGVGLGCTALFPRV